MNSPSSISSRQSRTFLRSWRAESYATGGRRPSRRRLSPWRKSRTDAASRKSRRGGRFTITPTSTPTPEFDALQATEPKARNLRAERLARRARHSGDRRLGPECRGDYVRFAAAPAGLSVVDKAATFAAYWTHPDDLIAEWRHKAQMCAEVLVPDCAPATYIKGAYVASPQAHDAVNALNVGLVVKINKTLFFS